MNSFLQKIYVGVILIVGITIVSQLVKTAIQYCWGTL